MTKQTIYDMTDKIARLIKANIECSDIKLEVSDYFVDNDGFCYCPNHEGDVKVQTIRYSQYNGDVQIEYVCGCNFLFFVMDIKESEPMKWGMY